MLALTRAGLGSLAPTCAAKGSGAKACAAKDSVAKGRAAKDSGANDSAAKDSGAKDSGAKESGAKESGAKDSDAKGRAAKAQGTESGPWRALADSAFGSGGLDQHLQAVLVGLAKVQVPPWRPQRAGAAVVAGSLNSLAVAAGAAAGATVAATGAPSQRSPLRALAPQTASKRRSRPQDQR